MICEAPGLEKAAGHLVSVPPRPAPGGERWRQRYEKCKRRMLL